MKDIIYIIAILLVAGCAGRAPQMTPAKNIVFEPNEENEYELIIIDPGFDRWFSTNAKPVNFYSPQYYASKNRMYVASWNNLVAQTASRANSPFTSYINYESHIDYGLELNYKLYNYFRYVESTVGRYYRFPS